MVREYMLGRGRTKDGQDVVRESSETSKGDDEVVEDVLDRKRRNKETDIMIIMCLYNS